MSTIAEKIEKINNIKLAIKTAIIAKGQPVGDVFDEYADAISKISSGGGSDVQLPEISDDDPLTFVRVDNLELDSSISIINKSVTNTKTIEFNKNDVGWTTYVEGTHIPMDYGDKVQFRSTNTTAMSTGSTTYRYFKTKGGLYNCGGTLASLMNNNATMQLPGYCFMNLFNYCNIINAPILPWTNFQSTGSCYNSMFSCCTSLVNAPALPATTLAINCYNSMFQRCISLVNAPALPATTLASNCYTSMFYGCTSLVNAPALPAIEVPSYAYNNMFDGCVLLKEIYCNARYYFSNTITSIISTGWLNGVPNTSDCVFHKNPNWTGPTKRGIDSIPSNWQIVNWIIE